MKKEVEKAIAEIRQFYHPSVVEVFESPCGGAHVLIQDIPLGAPYTQASTWIAFFITNACPYADTYPFYVRPDLSRLDGAAPKTPIHLGNNWAPGVAGAPARVAIMVSRRQTHAHCIGKESPLLKLQTVIKWMLQQ